MYLTVHVRCIALVWMFCNVHRFFKWMKCGKVKYLFKKSVFLKQLLICLANRFDKRPDEFGAGLDSFLNPSMRCNSFLSTVPSIEVRAYVSIIYFELLTFEVSNLTKLIFSQLLMFHLYACFG